MIQQALPDTYWVGGESWSKHIGKHVECLYISKGAEKKKINLNIKCRLSALFNWL